jgi:hypothetical protein
MSLGILLAARFSTGSFLRKRGPRQLLDDIDRWWIGHASELSPWIAHADEGTPAEPMATHVTLHPAAGAVAFEVTEPGLLVITATTSLVGPGYHRFLVDHLRRMASDLDLTWVDPSTNDDLGDETGYFETGDRDAVTAAMLDFGAGLARAILDNDEEGATDFAVGMPPDVEYPGAGFLVTTMGPRDRELVERAAAGDPATIASLNPWWDDALDARFSLRRALVQLWCQVSWAGPLEEAERSDLAQVDADLELAAAAGLDVPGWEWNEVRALLGRPPFEPGAARPSTPIGYRRRPMRAMVGSWAVTVPGSFYLTTDGDAFLAFRDGTFRMMTWSRDPDVDPANADPWDVLRMEPGRLVATIEGPELLGCATELEVQGEGGAPQRLVSAVVSAPDTLAVATLTHPPEHAGQALDIVRSMRPNVAPVEPPPRWAPRPAATWNQLLLVSALQRLVDEPAGGWFIVCSVPGAPGYVQASTMADGTLHAEAAGERYDPRLADPVLVARLGTIGWSEARADYAGNHVRDWAPPADPATVAARMLDTLREVYALADDQLVDLILDR